MEVTDQKPNEPADTIERLARAKTIALLQHSVRHGGAEWVKAGRAPQAIAGGGA